MSDDDKPPVSGGVLVSADEIPQNPRKRSILWGNPVTQTMIETIRTGIPDDMEAPIVIDRQVMAENGIKDARTTFRKLFEIFIENEGMTTTSGKPLGVEAYRDVDGYDVVRVIAKDRLAPPRFCRRKARKESENKQE